MITDKLDFHIVQTQSRRLDLSAGFRGLWRTRSMQRLPFGDGLNVRGRSVIVVFSFCCSFSFLSVSKPDLKYLEKYKKSFLVVLLVQTLPPPPLLPSYSDLAEVTAL